MLKTQLPFELQALPEETSHGFSVSGQEEAPCLFLNCCSFLPPALEHCPLPGLWLFSEVVSLQRVYSRA